MIASTTRTSAILMLTNMRIGTFNYHIYALGTLAYRT